MMVKENIKRHLTGAIKILTLSFVIIILFSASVSALTYQEEITVQFTFDPSLSVELTSSDISISGLTPGLSSNSNTISVNVTTNNMLGYTLSAKVGGEGQIANSSDLVNTTANASFSSLADNASLTLANFGDNKWGYTTASSVGADSVYSGLLYNTDKIINQTTSYSGTAKTGYPGTNSTSFTIGAKAAATQVSGNYTNVITFTVVPNTVNSN